MFPSTWVKFGKTELTQELAVQHITSVNQRQRDFYFHTKSHTLVRDTPITLLKRGQHRSHMQMFHHSENLYVA